MRQSWLLLVLAWLASTAPAAGQQSGPIRLAPLPPPGEEMPDGTRPRDGGDVLPGGIRVRDLDLASEGAIGVIGEEGGGLGQDMWDGSLWTDAVRLVGTLPETYPLRAGYDLARRVLSTAAPAPTAGKTPDSESLLAVRIDRLAAIGAGERATEMARAVRGRSIPDHLAAVAVRGYFAEGEIAPGCRVADGYGGGYESEFWQKVLIVCQVASGNPDQVGLGLDLLRDQGVAIDPVFASVALAASGGGKVTMPRREDTSPDLLTLALLVASGAELPDWLAEDVQPTLLPALLTAERVTPEAKLHATHRGLRAGVVRGPRASEVYFGLRVDDETLAAGLSAPDDLAPDLRWAYFYLAAERELDPLARANLLVDAWRAARTAGALDIVARATADLLVDIPATAGFAWMAGDAADVALLAGRDRLALDWYRLMRNQEAVVPALSTAVVVLWPAMRVIGREADRGFSLADGTTAITRLAPAVSARGVVPWDAARLSRWIELTAARAPVPDHALVLEMLSALGDPVDDTHWLRVSAGTPGVFTMPSSALLAGLSRAARAGRKAETALYALHALGQTGGAPSPRLVAQLVAALDEAGLHEPARSMAREMVVRELNPVPVP
ncbi:MAG: hypothetical protein JJ899_13395 [Alphaproteobacteria bacterium]|nr:hypothetical protein [Alphaproteobacteria bacterium]